MKDWLKFPVVLVVVAVISAASLAGVKMATDPAKQKIQDEITQNSLKVVMPEAKSFDKSKTVIKGEQIQYMTAKDAEGKLLGYVIEGSAEGYSSRIRVMVGVENDFRIKAVKVLYQNETPGLGDKIEEVHSKKTWGTVITGTSPDESALRPWFQVQFDNKSIPVALDKSGGDIQAITGATISSQAVCKAVNSAVEYLKEALKNPARE